MKTHVFENISRRIKLETEKTLPTANTTNMQKITMEAPGNRTREKNIKFSMSELRETAEAQSKNTKRSGWGRFAVWISYGCYFQDIATPKLSN